MTIGILERNASPSQFAANKSIIELMSSLINMPPNYSNTYFLSAGSL